MIYTNRMLVIFWNFTLREKMFSSKTWIDSVCVSIPYIKKSPVAHPYNVKFLICPSIVTYKRTTNLTQHCL